MDDKPSPRADFLSALAWIGLGGLIVYGSWTMDRLENLKINPYTAPGLVPGILGAGLVVMGLVLLLRAGQAGGFRLATGRQSTGVGHGRLALTLGLCLAFGFGLVGRGVPFWLATLVFVFLFILAFEYPQRREAGQVKRGALVAFACAAGTAFVVTIVFQEIFLVRLP